MSPAIAKPSDATRLPGQPWTFRDAADFLGCSVRTLERAASNGQLRQIMLGARRKAISDAEVQRLANEGLTAPVEPLKLAAG